jgi:hypothetical protein
MSGWKKIKSVIEWGFFLGVVCWILATGLSNKIGAIGIWVIILSRVALALAHQFIPMRSEWWMRSIVLGLPINVVLALLSSWAAFGGMKGFWLLWIAGIGCSFVMEWILKFRLHAEAAQN